MRQNLPEQESSHIALNTHAQTARDMGWPWIDRKDMRKSPFIEGIARFYNLGGGSSQLQAWLPMEMIRWTNIIRYRKIFGSLKKQAELSTQTKWDTGSPSPEKTGEHT